METKNLYSGSIVISKKIRKKYRNINTPQNVKQAIEQFLGEITKKAV